MRPIVAALVALPLLAGCASQIIAQRQAELATFIGRPESDVVRQFGVPSRTYDTDGRRFLAYTESRLDLLPGGFATYGYGYGFNRYGGYGGFAGGFPAEAVERVCETTFELTAGKVVGAVLRGNSCG